MLTLDAKVVLPSGKGNVNGKSPFPTFPVAEIEREKERNTKAFIETRWQKGYRNIPFSKFPFG